MLFNTEKVLRLTMKLEKADQEKAEIRAKHSEEISKIKAEYEEKLKKVEEKWEDKLARLESNQDVSLEEAKSELKKENSQLTIDKAILQKEVAMYEKAFENLGFDVKDMKEILNKLVDGLVSKNQIQLVK